MDILVATKYIFSQLLRYPLTLPEGKYAQPCLCLSNASIGQHIRHPLDFYNCLIKGMERAEISYDERERNPLIERDPVKAKEQLLEVEKRLEEVCQSGDKPLRVSSSYALSESKGSAKTTVMMKSSLHRELSYVMDHNVHHMALIRVAWQEILPGQPLPKTFGVAFSTLRHADTG